jgi:hypothetical protein
VNDAKGMNTSHSQVKMNFFRHVIVEVEQTRINPARLDSIIFRRPPRKTFQDRIAFGVGRRL